MISSLARTTKSISKPTINMDYPMATNLSITDSLNTSISPKHGNANFATTKPTNTTGGKYTDTYAPNTTALTSKTI